MVAGFRTLTDGGAYRGNFHKGRGPQINKQINKQIKKTNNK